MKTRQSGRRGVKLADMAANVAASTGAMSAEQQQQPQKMDGQKSMDADSSVAPLASADAPMMMMMNSSSNNSNNNNNRSPSKRDDDDCCPPPCCPPPDMKICCCRGPCGSTTITEKKTKCGCCRTIETVNRCGCTKNTILKTPCGCCKTFERRDKCGSCEKRLEKVTNCGCCRMNLCIGPCGCTKTTQTIYPDKVVRTHEAKSRCGCFNFRDTKSKCGGPEIKCVECILPGGRCCRCFEERNKCGCKKCIENVDKCRCKCCKLQICVGPSGCCKTQVCKNQCMCYRATEGHNKCGCCKVSEWKNKCGCLKVSERRNKCGFGCKTTICKTPCGCRKIIENITPCGCSTCIEGCNKCIDRGCCRIVKYYCQDCKKVMPKCCDDVGPSYDAPSGANSKIRRDACDICGGPMRTVVAAVPSASAALPQQQQQQQQFRHNAEDNFLYDVYARPERRSGGESQATDVMAKFTGSRLNPFSLSNSLSRLSVMRLKEMSKCTPGVTGSTSESFVLTGVSPAVMDPFVGMSEIADQHDDSLMLSCAEGCCCFVCSPVPCAAGCCCPACCPAIIVPMMDSNTEASINNRAKKTAVRKLKLHKSSNASAAGVVGETSMASKEKRKLSRGRKEGDSAASSLVLAKDV